MLLTGLIIVRYFLTGLCNHIYNTVYCTICILTNMKSLRYQTKCLCYIMRMLIVLFSRAIILVLSTTIDQQYSCMTLAHVITFLFTYFLSI